MLTATEVSVDLRSKRVLDSVSVSIGPGEVVAIVGPNGAGKSTLLTVLSGARRPATGSVTLAGKPLNVWPLRALARQRAVLAQDSELSFSYRVLDVVLLGRSPHADRSRCRSDDLAVACAALRETAVAHLADRIYTTLSGGERQRVQLARVLAQLDFTRPPAPPDCRMLLLDEPTSALDLTHQHAVLATARRLSDQGFGVLAILHDLNQAARYADRIVLMDCGRVRYQGRPQEVLTEATIGQVYNLPVTITRHPVHDCLHVIPS